MVNQRFVVRQQQLLADGQRRRMQARAAAADEDDAFARGGMNVSWVGRCALCLCQTGFARGQCMTHEGKDHAAEQTQQQPNSHHQRFFRRYRLGRLL